MDQSSYPVQFSIDYPERPLNRIRARSFGYVEGVIRWHSRVAGYAVILITDRYPPFTLSA